ADLRAELAGLDPRPPAIPVFVTTGDSGSDSSVGAFDADHWVANLRNPVKFTQAVAAAGAGHGVFVEVSPHPLLGYAIDQSLEGVHHHTLGTLARDTNDTFTFRANLNATHTAAPPDTPHPPEPRAVLPATPWHHTRHWLAVAEAPETLQRSMSGGPNGAEWFHALDWPVREIPAAPAAGRWLVLSEPGPGEELAALLGPGSVAMDATVLDDGGDEAALRAALSGARYVLYAPPGGPRVDAATGHRLFDSARRLLTVLAGMAEAPRLVLLTRNAQPVEDGDRADPAQAVLWGMGRTIRLEHPELWAGLVDVDESAPAELVARILAAEAADSGRDDQAVYRRGQRHVPRLERRDAPAVALTRLEPGTSHLVIGATGNVGPYLVRQLAEMGAATIVAVSRSGGTLPELEAELKAAGTTLVAVAADAADPAAMAALFARFGDDLPPLEGIYLAALAGTEVLLTEMTDSDVTTMFRPKLDAAEVLHRLTLTRPVRRFVLFSSITGILGSRWLGHYTAANAFLDALAYARRALGLAATVVDWGLWKSWADARPSTKSAGLTPMPNETAIRMMPAVLSPDAGIRSVVAGADWPGLAEAYQMRAPLPVVDHLLPGGDSAGIDGMPAPAFGSLLGEPVEGARVPTWRAALRPADKPYPGRHRVRGVEVVPVSVLLQTLSAAAGGAILGDVRFEYPVVAEQPRVIQVLLEDESVTVYSSAGPDTPADRWTRHCGARIVPVLPEPAPAREDTPEIAWDPAAIGELQAKSGVDGQPFPWTLDGFEPVPGGLRAAVTVPDASAPALLDAAVHVARLLDGSESLMLPAALEALAAGSAAGEVLVEVRRRVGPGEDLVADARVLAQDGRTCLDVRGLRYALVDSAPALADAGPSSVPVDVPAWSTMTADQILGELRVRLRAILARELGMPENAVDYDRPFPELGLDSMMAMTLLRDAKQLVQRELSSTMLWNHPTVGSFAEHVAGLLTPAAEAPAESSFAAEAAEDSVSVLDALFDSIESSEGGSR
ncbi:MAG: SDR family NAD(P)-dependent oxidoreductase, partial [Mycobacterium sp.]